MLEAAAAVPATAAAGQSLLSLAHAQQLVAGAPALEAGRELGPTTGRPSGLSVSAPETFGADEARRCCTGTDTCVAHSTSLHQLPCSCRVYTAGTQQSTPIGVSAASSTENEGQAGQQEQGRRKASAAKWMHTWAFTVDGRAELANRLPPEAPEELLLMRSRSAPCCCGCAAAVSCTAHEASRIGNCTDLVILWGSSLVPAESC